MAAALYFAMPETSVLNAHKLDCGRFFALLAGIMTTVLRRPVFRLGEDPANRSRDQLTRRVIRYWFGMMKMLRMRATVRQKYQVLSLVLLARLPE